MCDCYWVRVDPDEDDDDDDDDGGDGDDDDDDDCHYWLLEIACQVKISVEFFQRCKAFFAKYEADLVYKNIQ